MNSPCLRCSRVADPAACENKNCVQWRRWFTQKWDDMRLVPRIEAERRPKETEGVVIGGVRYALPHRVRGYLDKDPCRDCLCPRDLCALPCRVKRDWLKAWEDTMV